MSNKEIFSKNLRYYMEKNNIAQIDLMTKFSLSSSTVSDWCNGKKYPRIDKIEMLANYFGIEKSDLIEDRGKIELYEKMIQEMAKYIEDTVEDDICNKENCFADKYENGHCQKCVNCIIDYFRKRCK